MLLIDHDEAQPGQRGKERAARSNDDVKLIVAQMAPDIVAFTRTEAGMDDCDAIGEAGCKAGNSLRRQGDFRNQYDGLFSSIYRLGNGTQVDLRLAAAGDAVKQELSRSGTPSSLLAGGSTEG